MSANNNTQVIGAGVLAIVVVAAIVGYSRVGPVSGSDHRFYGDQCADWISAEFADDKPAEAFDSWKRRGQIVFAVAYDSRSGDSRSIQLCVVDKGTGSMMKPSAFNTSQWRRLW